MDRVQLGVLYLALHDPAASASSLATTSTNAWCPLSTDFVDSGGLADLSSSADLVKLLGQLLHDPGIRFQAECQVVDDNLVVRCSLVPSDGRGASWRVRAKDRSKHLARLFSELRMSWDVKDGRDTEYVLASKEEDRYSIHDLYARIPSPKDPSYDDWTPLSLGDQDLRAALVSMGDLNGLKTTLFRYQVRSVNRMIQMEMDPRPLVDPRFTPLLQAGSDERYYVDLSNFDIQLRPGRYTLPPGGILCEQMGVGKTLMCLSLILATLHQPAQPPPHDFNLSPMLTQHMLDTYPFESINEVRSRASIPSSATREAQTGVPRLSDMCANILACRDRSADATLSTMHVIPHVSDLLNQQTFYLTYPPDTSDMRHAKAATMRPVAQRVLISNATLVVVPPILVEQWMQEIHKHIEPGTLKVLRIDGGDLPDVEELVRYDIILMDVARLGREDTVARMRLDLDPSVLLQVRWKRLILDEGHVAGEKTSNAMNFAQQLNVERRWAVTGTPTRHLQQGGEAQIASLHLSPSKAAELNGQTGRGWGRRDINDVERLGIIVSNYLGAQPFRSDVPFSDLVTKRLRQKHLPFGAVGRLRYLMDSMMVKHRTNEIDTEASLPPSTVENVMLPFEPMQRMTYNVLASLVAANVYTSNFEDADYFLHPKNLKSFQQVVRNMHIACTWFSGTQVGVEQCLKTLQASLDKGAVIEGSEAHTAMTSAVVHLTRALDTPGWAEWVRYSVSVPIHVSGLPTEVRSAWSESRGQDTEWIDASSLLTIREANSNGCTLDELADQGRHTIDNVVSLALEEDASADKERVKKEEKVEKTGHTVAQSTAAARPRTISPRKRKLPPSSGKQDRVDLALAQAEQNAQIAAEQQARAHLPRPLPDEVEIKTRSHKINHVLWSIQNSEPDDKFVIYGDSAELGLLTEALDLVDVETVFAGQFVSLASRIVALEKFKSPNVKAILVDIKVAARGLNLVMANRMILLAPMWSLDTQAQAIKRIHRIGQTRPTKIEILVTEGTFEEDIAKRASSSRTEKDEELYSRALIEHPRFVCAEHESDHRFRIRFMPKPDADSSAMPSGQSTPDAELVTPHNSAASFVASSIEIKDISPSPIEARSAMKQPAIGPAEGEQPKKKKAKVAFA